MHATLSHRPKPKPARITSWARLWLKCIAALLSCATHLTPALQRRLPVLDLPRRVLARHVARLILLCAIFQAEPPKICDPRGVATLRALLRAGVQRHLTNRHGAFDLAKIAQTCANPDQAIADMIAVLERGLTRRRPILPRAASEALPRLAPAAPAAACDTS